MTTATLDDLTAARARIAAAYDPSALESAGVRLMATLADHLRRVRIARQQGAQLERPGGAGARGA